MSIPAYPNLILDTSREAIAQIHGSQVPWSTRDRQGFVWVSAFQTNSIFVRARSRLNGKVLVELALVKDAHKYSDRAAMDAVADRLRDRIAEYKGHTGGSVTFYEPPPTRALAPPLYA